MTGRWASAISILIRGPATGAAGFEDPEMAVNFKWDYTKYPGFKKYPELWQPIRIGGLTIPNRIKYAATEDNLNDRQGFVTDLDVAYMRARAKGVAGGICTIQGVYMDPKGEGQGYVGQAAAYDDKFVPGLKRLADAIREEKAVSNYQLMHCGRVGGVNTGYAVGPSAVPQRLRVLEPVREMSRKEIQTCVDEHARAARRGIQAGFDIIEISGIVGYLVSNFLSSYTNRRTDEYGGGIEKRCRFMVDIVKAVRKEIGPAVPLIIRLCAEELLDDVGGNTPEESMITYKMAEQAGVDCLSVTQGWQESRKPVISRDIAQGSWLYNAKRAKEAVKVPVSMAYRLFNPALPAKAIRDGILDIWENCRPQIADPLMPLKVLEGREEDIRPCVACNLCLARLFRNAPMTCYINPECAHEWDPKWSIAPAASKKTVMIVGAGPAGLETAWTAAKRGHDVHVYDSQAEPGGQLRVASKGPYGDDELYGVVRFQMAQCEKSGVKFHMGTEVTPGLVEEEMPDAIVLATGARFVRGTAPGFDRRNVFSAAEVLEGKADAGTNVVVWGGRKPAMAAAFHLARSGRKVTMVCRDRKAGKDVNPSFVWRYMSYLRKGGVRIFNECDIHEIADGHVVVRTHYGTLIPVPADSVVYAERAPFAPLKAAAAANNIEVHVIGDALVPRTSSNAVHDGYRTGIRI